MDNEEFWNLFYLPFKTPPTTSNAASSTSSPTSSTRRVIKKKKLEFIVNQDGCEKTLNSHEDDENIHHLDLKSLKSLVEEKRAKLEVLRRHQTEKENLVDLTDKWKDAGLDGLDKLRECLQPARTSEEILDGFKIPHEMFL